MPSATCTAIQCQVLTPSLPIILVANAPLDPADTQVGITGRIPDEVEQVTGIERRELYKLMDGVEVRSQHI